MKTENLKFKEGGNTPERATQFARLPGTRCYPLILAMFAAFALAGCGTMSNLKPAQAGQRLDFSGYNKVLVQDFTDQASEREGVSKRAMKQGEMSWVCSSFADRLAAELRNTGCFKTVARIGTADESTLLIGGNVSRYEEGNATARLWVGLGAGSSYFDAQVEFRHGGTGELLGTLTVNKNSWVGGGAIAASQSPDTFMHDAAVKVASEVQKVKLIQTAEK